MVASKEKEEKKENIAVKGITTEEKDLKRWITKFLNEKLEINIEVKGCWERKGVYIAKMENWEDKMKVMANKYKLKNFKRGKIFIEHDLTWQERQIQGKISKWAKEEREKGSEVKVGYARAKIGGIWKKWEDIKKELEG